MASLVDVIVAIIHCYRFCVVAFDVLLYATIALVNTLLPLDKAYPTVAVSSYTTVSLLIPRISADYLICKWALHLSFPVLRHLDKLEATGVVLTVAFGRKAGIEVSCSVAELVMRCDSSLLRPLTLAASDNCSSSSEGSTPTGRRGHTLKMIDLESMHKYLRPFFIGMVNLSIAKASMVVFSHMSLPACLACYELTSKNIRLVLSRSPREYISMHAAAIGVYTLTQSCDGGPSDRVCLFLVEGDLSATLLPSGAELTIVISSLNSHLFNNNDYTNNNTNDYASGERAVLLDCSVSLDLSNPHLPVARARASLASLDITINVPEARSILAEHVWGKAVLEQTRYKDADRRPIDCFVCWESLEVTAASIQVDLVGISLDHPDHNHDLCGATLRLGVSAARMTASSCRSQAPIAAMSVLDLSIGILSVSVLLPDAAVPAAPLLLSRGMTCHLTYSMLCAEHGVALAERLVALDDGDGGAEKRWRRCLEDTVEACSLADSGASFCEATLCAESVNVAVSQIDTLCCRSAVKAAGLLLERDGSSPVVYRELASALMGTTALTVYRVSVSVDKLTALCIAVESSSSDRLHPTIKSAIELVPDTSPKLSISGIAGCVSTVASDTPSARVTASMLSRSDIDTLAINSMQQINGGRVLGSISNVRMSLLHFPAQLHTSSGADGAARLVVGIACSLASYSADTLRVTVDAAVLAPFYGIARAFSEGVACSSAGRLGRARSSSTVGVGAMPPLSLTPSSATHISLAEAEVQLEHEGQGVLRLHCRHLQLGAVLFGEGVEQVTGELTSLRCEDLMLDHLKVPYRRLLLSEVDEHCPSKVAFHSTRCMNEPQLIEIEIDAMRCLYLHRPALSLACYWEIFCEQMAQSAPPRLAVSSSSSGVARVALLMRRVEVHIPVSSLGADAVALICSEARCFIAPPGSSAELRAHLSGPLQTSGLWMGELDLIRHVCSTGTSMTGDQSSAHRWRLPLLARKELALSPGRAQGLLHDNETSLYFDCTVNGLVISSWCNSNIIGRHDKVSVGIEIRPPSVAGNAPIVIAPIISASLDWTLAQGQYSALLLSIFQNFKELITTVPDTFVYPEPTVHDGLPSDRCMQGLCMDSKEELLSSVSIRFERGRITTVQNEAAYYDLVARSLDERRGADTGLALSVPSWAHSNTHRDAAFNLYQECPSESDEGSGAGCQQAEVCVIDMEDIFVDIYRRQQGGGFGIDSSAAMLCVTAPDGTTVLCGQAGATAAAVPAIRFLQQEVGNIRQCFVHCSHSVFTLAAAHMARIGAFFSEPVAVASERLQAVTARALCGPIETRHALDFSLEATECTLVLAEGEGDCVLAASIAFLRYDHAWRGFLQSGPGRSSVAVSIKVDSLYAAPRTAAPLQFATTNNSRESDGSDSRRVSFSSDQFDLRICSDHIVRAPKGVLSRNRDILSPHMVLSQEMLLPSEGEAPTALQSCSLLLSVSREGAVGVCFRASRTDMDFLSDTAQRAHAAAVAAHTHAASLQEYRQRLPQLLNDLSDCSHMPGLSHYYPYVHTADLGCETSTALSSTDYSARASCEISFILSNGIFDTNILRADVYSPTLSYSPSQGALVAAAAATIWTYHDDASVWEPLVERADVTVEGLSAHSADTNPISWSFVIRSSPVEMCLAQRGIIALLTKLSLADRSTAERAWGHAEHRPYRVLNRLGVALKGSLVVAGGVCVAASEIPDGGSWSADASAVSAGQRDIFLSIGLLIDGEVFRSSSGQALVRDGTFPLYLESPSSEPLYSPGRRTGTVYAEAPAAAPRVFLTVRTLVNGSKELLVTSALSITNSTDRYMRLLLRRGKGSDISWCAAYVRAGEAWPVPVTLALPQAEMYVSALFEEADAIKGQMMDAAAHPDPSQALVPSMSHFVLAGSWDRPLRAAADILPLPGTAGCCLLILLRARGRGGAQVSLRYPCLDGYRPCTASTSFQEATPNPRGVGGAARGLLEEIGDLGGLALSRGADLPLSLQLCAPLEIRSALPQPLFYRLCCRAGSAVAEGVLVAGCPASIYQLASLLPGGAVLISLRMLNYVWSQWTVLLERDSPYGSGDSSADIHLYPLHLRDGSSSWRPPGLDLRVRARDGVVTVSCAYVFSNRTGADLDLASGSGGADRFLRLPARAEGAADLLLRGLGEPQRDTAAPSAAAAMAAEETVCVSVTPPCNHMQQVRVRAPAAGTLGDLCRYAGIMGRADDYVAVYYDLASGAPSPAVYSPLPPVDSSADGGLASVAQIMARQRGGSRDVSDASGNSRSCSGGRPDDELLFGMTLTLAGNSAPIFQLDTLLSSLDLAGRGLHILHSSVLRLHHQALSLQPSSSGDGGGIMSLLGGSQGRTAFTAQAEATRGALPLHQRRKLLGALGMAGFFRLRVRGAGSWSDPMDLHRAGLDDAITVGSAEMGTLAVRGEGDWQDVTHITILPRYLVASRLQRDTVYARQVSAGSGGTRISAGGVAAFDFSNPSMPRLLQLRVQGSDRWAGEVDITKPGVAYCQVAICSPTSMVILKVETELLGGALVASVSEQSPLWPPYRLENLTGINVRCEQEGAEGAEGGELLAPGKSTGYYWERPHSKPHRLRLQFELPGGHAQCAAVAIDRPTEHPIRLIARLPPLESASHKGPIRWRRGDQGVWAAAYAVLNGPAVYLFRDSSCRHLVERVPLALYMAHSEGGTGLGMWLAVMMEHAPPSGGVMGAAIGTLRGRGSNALQAEPQRDGSLLRILLLLAADSLQLFSPGRESTSSRDPNPGDVPTPSMDLRKALLEGGIEGALFCLHGIAVDVLPIQLALERIAGAGLGSGAAIVQRLADLQILSPNWAQVESESAVAAEGELAGRSSGSGADEVTVSPVALPVGARGSSVYSGLNRAGSALLSGVIASASVAASVHSSIVASASGALQSSDRAHEIRISLGGVTSFLLNTSIEAQDAFLVSSDPPSELTCTSGRVGSIRSTASEGGSQSVLYHRLSISRAPLAARSQGEGATAMEVEDAGSVMFSCSSDVELRNWLCEMRAAVEKEWLHQATVSRDCRGDNWYNDEILVSTTSRPDGSTLVLSIAHRSADSEAVSERGRVDASWRSSISIETDSLSVTAIDADLVEICRISLWGLVVQLDTGMATTEVAISASSIGACSGLPRPCFPVVFAPRGDGEGGEMSSPALQFIARQRHHQSNIDRQHDASSDIESSLLYIEECSVWIAPLQVGLEEESMARTYRLLRALLTAYAKMKERTEGIVGTAAAAAAASDAVRSPEVQARSLLQSHRPRSTRSPRHVYLGLLRVHPLSALLSVRPSPLFPLSTAEIAMASLAAQLDSADMCLAEFTTEHTYGPPSLVSDMLATHYRQCIWRHMVRGREAVADSVDMVSDISGGAYDMVSRPADGSDHPSHLLRGLTRSGRSLVSRTIGGTSALASQLTGGVGRGVSLMTLDSDYFRDRSSRRLARQTASVSEGIFVGTKELSQSVAEGISGVVTAPYRGWEAGGSVGLGVGFARGLLGVALKPAVGVLDLASRATEGIRNSSALPGGASAYAGMVQLQRSRLPRHLSAIEGVIPPYEPSAAAAQHLSDCLFIGFNSRVLIRSHCHIPSSSDPGELSGLPRDRSYVVLVAIDRVLLVELSSLREDLVLRARIICSCMGVFIEQMRSDIAGDLLLFISSAEQTPASVMIIDRSLRDYYCLQRFCEQVLGAAAARQQLLRPRDVLLRQDDVRRGGGGGSIASMLTSSAATYTYVLGSSVLYEYPSVRAPEPSLLSEPLHDEESVCEPLLAQLVNSFFGAAAEAAAEPPALSGIYPLVDVHITGPTVEPQYKGYSIALSNATGQPMRFLRREAPSALSIALGSQNRPLGSLVETTRQIVKLFLPDQQSALAWKEALLARNVCGTGIGDCIVGGPSRVAAPSMLAMALRTMSGSLYHGSSTKNSPSLAASCPDLACIEASSARLGVAESIESQLLLPTAGLPQQRVDSLKVVIAEAFAAS